MALQWEDTGSVHLLTTIHQITDHVNRERKKPRTTSTNSAITRRAFCSQRQVFAIPKVIDDYNYFMNGVDRADQLWASFPTQLKAQPNWLPLFHWLLDTSIVNSFILFRHLNPQARHRAFRLDLVQSLYTYSVSFSPITPIKPPTGYSKKTTTIYSSKHRKALPKSVPEGNHQVKHLPSSKRLSCIFLSVQREEISADSLLLSHL